MVRHMKSSLIVIGFLACAAALPGQAPGSKARALYDSGLEAIGRATTRQELQAAAMPLSDAKDSAPDWPEVHYALGRVDELLEVYDLAAARYESYLELAPGAPDRDEVLGRVRSCRLRQERLEGDKRLMASGKWAKVMDLPPVSFSPPMVSTRFRLGRDGRMEAQHPYLHQVDQPRRDAVKEEWSPVEFEGRFFTYEYRVYFAAQDPPRTEYTIETIRGEIIPGSPCRVRQAVWHGSSPTLFPHRAGLQELVGEVLHEVR